MSDDARYGCRHCARALLVLIGWLIWGVFHKGAPSAAGDWTVENFRVLLDPHYWSLVGRSIFAAVPTTLFATLIGLLPRSRAHECEHGDAGEGKQLEMRQRFTSARIR